jgi:hypothetical protein
LAAGVGIVMAEPGNSNRAALRAQPFMSIRARLVVIALLAVVPLMLNRVWLLQASRAERIEIAATEALDLVRRGAQAQREIITSVRSMLQVMARAYVTMLARGETCNLYLSDLASGMAWIKGMSIIGPDGRIKCSNQPAVIGLDLSDRGYYRETLQTKDFILSNYLISRTMRQPTIVAAYPMQAIDPNTNAVVVASINLQSVRALVGSLERRPGAMVLLIDGSGTVIAGEPQGAEWMGKKLSDAPLLRDMLESGEGTMRTAGLLMEAARGDDDLPARYGGEEFVLLVPGADLERALAIAERLRRTVEDLCIAHASSPSGQVTISVGVASLVPGINEAAEALVEAADAGLYSAKRRGRNAVVAHGPVTLAVAS